MTSTESGVLRAPSAVTRTRILVLDDERGAASKFVEGLARDSEVHTTRRELLVARVASSHFDACLIDRRTLEQSAEDLVTRLRAADPDLAIAVLAEWSLATEAHSLLAGVDAILALSHDPASSVALVRRVITQRRALRFHRRAATTRKVLIVDDELDAVLPVVTDALGRADFQVESVADGYSALRLVRELSIQIVVADLKTPGLGGTDLVDAVLRYDPSITPILMTDFSRVEDLVRSLPIDTSEFLLKPVGPTQIVATLERAWARRAGQPQVSQRAHGERASATRVSVLHVEDYPEQARTVQRLLRGSPALSFDVLHAASLGEALEQLADGSFDVIVSDLGLPDCSGAETIARLAAVAGRTPIIVLTCDDSPGIADRVLRAGALDYISKQDLTTDLLMPRIRQVVARRRLLATLDAFVRDVQIGDANRRAVVDHLPHGIVVVDRVGHVLFANPAAERLFGREAQEFVGTHLGFPLPSEGVVQIDVARPGRDTRTAEVHVVATTWYGQPALLACVRDVGDLGKQDDDPLSVRSIGESRRHFVEHVIAAQDDERRRIARELHDETGQTLTSLLIGLQALNDSHAAAPVLPEIGRLTAIAERLVDGVGRLSRGLHPGDLDDLGLLVALEDLTAQFWRTMGIPAYFQPGNLDERVRLPARLELPLYRIVQEALANAAKHAKAAAIEVSIERIDAEVRVVVADDGVGFDVAARSGLRPDERGGLGLVSIRERVAALGGRFWFESALGSGTKLFVHVPLLEHER